jgi:response regulator RpfG family c-di-GMP phosphodiesterase
MTQIARRVLPHVLVVGDSEAARGFARRTSARCTVVDRAQSAVTALRQSVIDVAVVDLSSVPLRDGLRLVGRLCDEAADLAVIVISATPGLLMAADALRVGVFDCLLAPAAPADIDAAVDRALAWRERSREAAVDDGRRQEMYSTMAAIGASFIDSGIGSMAALDAHVAVLLKRDGAALAHARRVSAVSARLAAALGIGEPLAGQIARAALLHDVGKVAIPPDLADSPDPLTPRERELVRSHVRLTAGAMTASPFLAPSAPIVLAVRERFDGTGEPFGLSGEAIPIGARIIAVVKAFDTLAGSGASSASTRAAAARLVLDAGSRFDPAVVRTFLGCLDEGAGADEGAGQQPGGWYQCS